MTRKYAMVAINTKRQDDGVHTRRVLVSYVFKITKNKITTYYGTKLVSVDPYFGQSTATHKYTFKNTYYKLNKVEQNDDLAFLYTYNPKIYKKRKYHSIGKSAIEFTASSKQVAVYKFKARKELK